MLHEQIRFVVRMTASRRRMAAGPEGADPLRVEELMKVAPIIATRDVRLAARAGKRGGRSERTHPVRDRRSATLSISAMNVEVLPPKPFKGHLPSLDLAVVRVVELDPPTGDEPVEWILISSEPITTPEQILKIVDAYRTRWVIEELFKALKTGCSMERRQLESRHSLESALGLFLPFAVRLLALRTYARTAPNAPATTVLSEHELVALRTVGRIPLPQSPTVRDALLAIAALGGHLKRNGDPGWLVLARGLEKLMVAAQVVASLAASSAKM
jgi:hypothetical protein